MLLGVETEPVLRGAGVDPAVLADPDARLPARTVHALWRQASELSGNDTFGLMLSEHVKPGSFDVLDYLCRNAATVGAGLGQYCRYTQLLHDGIVATIDERSDEAQLRHVLADGTVVPRQYGEFIVASIIAIVRQALGQHVVPMSVQFLHPAPADTSRHRELFGCPVHFEADSNGFTLRREDYDAPLQEAQPGLFRVLEQHATHLLQEVPRLSNLVAQVRAAIVADLRHGTVSASSVAVGLGTSERTLRRRLDAEGTSYQRILSELRTELASRYMQEERLSIDEVALLLGFSDRSAFYRAFRQWTGQSPTEFRASHRAG